MKLFCGVPFFLFFCLFFFAFFFFVNLMKKSDSSPKFLDLSRNAKEGGIRGSLDFSLPAASDGGGLPTQSNWMNRESEKEEEKGERGREGGLQKEVKLSRTSRYFHSSSSIGLSHPPSASQREVQPQKKKWGFVFSCVPFLLLFLVIYLAFFSHHHSSSPKKSFLYSQSTPPLSLSSSSSFSLSILFIFLSVLFILVISFSFFVSFQQLKNKKLK